MDFIYGLLITQASLTSLTYHLVSSSQKFFRLSVVSDGLNPSTGLGINSATRLNGLNRLNHFVLLISRESGLRFEGFVSLTTLLRHRRKPTG